MTDSLDSIPAAIVARPPRKPDPRKWGDAKTEACRRLFVLGLSALQIATELRRGGWPVTRNAVIGFAARKGWVRRQVMSIARIAPAPRPQRRRAFRPPPPALEVEPTAAPKPEPVHARPTVALLALKGSHCRWPVAPGASVGEWEFCGGDALSGKPYCAGHCRIAYQPAGPRRAIVPRPSSHNWR